LETRILPIEGEKVLVKFYFTNQNLIPIGIRLVQRHEKTIETKHLRDGQKSGLPNAGWESARPERIDTGQHREFQNVDIVPTWNQLKQGHQIGDIHLFLQERSEGMKKPVVVVSFAKDPLSAGGLSQTAKPRIIAEIEKTFVQGSTWGTIHHWTNPDGTVTINCRGRQPRSP